MSRVVGCGFHFIGPSSGQTGFVSVCADAEAAIASRSHLVSLGHHRLRGVRDETELFTLTR